MIGRPSIPNSDAGPPPHSGPWPFPRGRVIARRATASDRVEQPPGFDSPRDPAREVLAAFANVSRRIEDLARELKCFGYFDDGDDRPRAA